jgi:hypothetical protein
MNKSFRKYEKSPLTGKPYKELFDGAPYKGIELKFTEAIELHRGLPTDGFRQWLLGRRVSLINKIFKAHTLIESKESGITKPNLIDMIGLNYWYDFVDIIDAEIQGVKKDNDPKTAVWAYYYFILHRIDGRDFKYSPNGSEAEMKRIAKEKGISFSNFKNSYYGLNRSTIEDNTKPGKIPVIRNVIELMKDNPRGLKIAHEYLNKAENKL